MVNISSAFYKAVYLRQKKSRHPFFKSKINSSNQQYVTKKITYDCGLGSELGNQQLHLSLSAKHAFSCLFSHVFFLIKAVSSVVT